MTRSSTFRILLGISFWLSHAYGVSAEFQVNQPPGNPWKLGDTVCIDMDGENVCGKVISTNSDKVTVQKAARGKGITVVPKTSAVPKPSPLPKKIRPARSGRTVPKKPVEAVSPTPLPTLSTEGLPMFNPRKTPDPTPLPTPVPTPPPTVYVAPPDTNFLPPTPRKNRRTRRPAVSEPEPVPNVSEEKETKNQRRQFLVGPALAMGTNFFFPGFALRLAVSDRLALGALGLFAKGSVGGSNLQAMGGFLTASYFTSPTAPFGLFIETGVGAYSLQGSTSTRSDQIRPPAALALLGWRGITRSGIGGSVSGGLQYVMGPASGAIQFHGPLPLLLVELHFGF